MSAYQATDDDDRARRIVRGDWSWLQTWAQDPELDGRLGPVDLEWFEHVLDEDQGVEIVVENPRGTPIGLVGCVWDPTGVAHVVSDIAVHPDHRRSGLGRLALLAAVSWPGHPAARMWVAFIDEENAAARKFFQHVGWADDGMDEGMIRVSCSVVNTPDDHRC